MLNNPAANGENAFINFRSGAFRPWKVLFLKDCRLNLTIISNVEVLIPASDTRVRGNLDSPQYGEYVS